MVLDSAQILHGKLERADAALVRDAFDLIKAAEHDPRALAAAVNCHSQYDAEGKPDRQRAISAGVGVAGARAADGADPERRWKPRGRR